MARLRPQYATPTLWMINGGPVPVRLDLMPDAYVLMFLGSAGVLTGIGFGFVPALRATRVDLAPACRARARRGCAHKC